MSDPIIDPSMQLRYIKAVHAMQTAVKIDQERGSPKHLRVGINSALCGQAALARLLVAKGIITWAEYQQAITEGHHRRNGARG